jgi:rifampicin phosphotransferase
MLKVYQFPGDKPASIAEVGGKGYSLMRATEAGLPVPPGFVLPVEFFSAWIDKLRTGLNWTKFSEAGPNELPTICNMLKEQARKSAFSAEQKEIVSNALKSYPADALFAVRSSSPTEDLEGASFAGGYETILGSTPATIFDDIARAFSSCLDHRVVVYKRQQGFGTSNPQIAIVIQRQVASDVAGVGFSLNPVTNNYDEAVFNANWGLGETVVAGLATPDTFVVNKVKSIITDRLLGGKQVSIWLTKDGGTYEKPDPRKDQFTINDSQVLELTKLIASVEDLYGKPIDIEWCFCEGKLYLLQARPVTTYIPLPEIMVTPPGARKRLYLDMLVSTQGVYKPLSTLATSTFQILVKVVGKEMFKADIWSTVDKSIPIVTEGKLYANVSNLIAIAGKDKVAGVLSNMDPLAAQALVTISEKQYESKNHSIRMLPLRLLAGLPATIWRVLPIVANPELARDKIRRALSEFEVEAVAVAKQDIPIAELTERMLQLIVTRILSYMVPIIIVSRLALRNLKNMIPASEQQELTRLEFALPNNVTTEMGLAMSNMAELLPKDMDAKALENGFNKRTLPAAFLDAWDSFMRLYGHRGPEEIDIAAPRYRDNPNALLSLLGSMRAEGTDTAAQKFERKKAEREETYDKLIASVARTDARKARHFHFLYRVFLNLGGYRETHKYYLIMVLDLIRQRILREAAKLVAQGKLSSLEQVFDLHTKELDRAIAGEPINLIECAQRNRAITDRLAKITHPPALIDSRGLIIRPPRPPVKEGEVAGIAISAGVTRGPVKVLNAPDEKPLNKGDILVARGTDPGWTPLFVNAGGVVLEIGGLLQHGALVAREYGLPCVAGIENATSLWQDGTMIEVDGSAGIVRVIQL